jgi:hypothetical protein
MSADHIHFFLNLRDHIKLYHWQTSSFARHRATDDVLKSLDDHIDLFVEICLRPQDDDLKRRIKALDKWILEKKENGQKSN